MMFIVLSDVKFESLWGRFGPAVWPECIYTQGRPRARREYRRSCTKTVKALHVELCNIIVVTNVTLKRKFDTNYIDLLRLEILTKLCFC